VISQNCVDLESSMLIEADHTSDLLYHCSHLSIIEYVNCSEFYIPRYCDQKRYLINEHDIHTQDDLTMEFQDVWKDQLDVCSNMLGCFSGRFSFQ